MITPELTINLHKRLIERTGGEFGIKDERVLESIINSVYQTFEGKDLYPSIKEKAARLCYLLNTRHAFVDGNKRIAMHALAVYLRMHDIAYRPSQEEVINAGLAIAANHWSYEKVLNWVDEIIQKSTVLEIF